MPSPREDEAFFVGYLATPPAVSRFLRRIVPVILLIVVVSAALIAARQRDPGNGEWDDQDRQLEGTLIVKPYPMLQSRDGRTFLLVGEGKHAVDLPAGAGDGDAIQVKGTIIQRERLRLFEASQLAIAASSPRIVQTHAFSGEFRTFHGQIVDPKCFAGAMKPGDGKTHKACAALCIRGGIPPAFVTDSGEMFILAGLPLDQFIDLVAEPVELRGVAGQIGQIPFIEVTQPPHAASK